MLGHISGMVAAAFAGLGKALLAAVFPVVALAYLSICLGRAFKAPTRKPEGSKGFVTMGKAEGRHR